MKTRNFTKLILIAFMFVFTGSLKAQTEFAPVGAEWYYNYNNFGNVGYVKITSESDTIIDNVFCKKLVKSIHVYDYVSYNEKKGVFGYEYLTQINDSVMIYSDGEFKKLYDFSAEIGDTLLIPGLGHYEEFTHGTAVVTGKGFMEFEGESLRYIDLKHLEDTPWQFSCYHNYDNGYNTARICEKIGNISGYLLPEKYFIVDDDEGGALRCYSDNETSITFSKEECDYVPQKDDVDEISASDIIKIYPNPATTNVEVSYTLPEGMTSATLVMTNTLGVNVKTVHLDGNNGKTTLSLEELPSGIYFYTIRCGENVKSGKLVKRN
jgi:hypothetical protein